jgi:hypothetical protein
MGMIGNSLAQGLISGANIQDGTVDTPDLKDSAVTTAKITDANVTTAKIADGAVTTVKITDANVTAAKLASGAAVSNIGYTPFKTQTTRFNGNLNTLGVSDATSGIYAIDANPTNAPIANCYGTLLAMFNIDIGIQYHFTYGGKVYWRKYSSGSSAWTAWKQILDVDGGALFAQLVQDAHSTTVSNNSFATEAMIRAHAADVTNAYPGYGFQKDNRLGLFLYAVDRSTLRIRGDGGTDSKLLTDANYPYAAYSYTLPAMTAGTEYQIAVGGNIGSGYTFLHVANFGNANTGNSQWGTTYTSTPFYVYDSNTNDSDSIDLPLTYGGHAQNSSGMTARYKFNSSGGIGSMSFHITPSFNYDGNGGVKATFFKLLSI